MSAYTMHGIFRWTSVQEYLLDSGIEDKEN